ncbi:MAG: D-glycero-beta-D-manno-heptose 1,7-bisphosphate 7-phosphatase [Oceanicoccus sp.]|uniref:D-glycero-beta-D-manno-heptose 1,7-bisphosphate 7-phosphatase n=1 Tax=Oceanicoccus sp. TaxID=2691044 RepID=UPI00260F85D4|nr:D-glycero-beta-D-manno-heptose 1,7-bisphosphate 7-phosphatase [Oceanicoccus sp.]MCP3907114.1 D-glycero-beta-D-manno-heptose 1,7-bisphosphate 7-phosphatase [Oceanicoccus sp.]MDG1773374.1 D-glycero-beta-D-manno-heptose 1,7-bisphosphate 7-phosphatase [Oceanicoccus sp.]
MKLIILDRDGVINEDSDAFVKSADEWIPVEGSIAAIARLSKAGFTVVVTTNQSGLGRGLFQESDLEAMHKKMHTMVKAAGGNIAAVVYCPHHPDDGCDCRKPKAGLITQIEQQFNTTAKGAFTIGDSLRDLEAGLKKGCIPILVKTGKGQKTLQKIIAEQNASFHNLAVYNNLAAAADAITQS